MSRPLVVTVEMDAAAQQRFDAERTEWFPAGRTAVGAHVTLFHAVPGPLEPVVTIDLDAATNRPPFAVRVARLMSLGRGVAYRFSADELVALHRQLQGQWWEHLTSQDRQSFRPHVTVQNKVSAETAQQTLTTLQRSFVPFDVTLLGLRLWRYDGGPWTLRRRFPFVAGPQTGRLRT